MDTEHPQLVLLRHGETQWSAGGRHTGRTDQRLTDAGERQAIAAGAFLQRRAERLGFGFAAVVSSPLYRARRTADLAGFPGAATDPDLMEWDYGPVEGRTTASVSAELGRDWEIFRDGVNCLPDADRPTGEVLEDVARRARAVLDRVEPVLRDGSDVLLVAHGHLLRVLTCVWLRANPMLAARLELDTAAICLLGYSKHRMHTIEGWNVAQSG